MADNDILKQLARMADGIESISATMNKPESLKKKIMEWVGFVVTVGGIVSIAEIIRSWIVGG